MKALTWILIIVVVAGGIFAYVQSQNLQDMTAERDKLQQDLTAVRAELTAEQNRPDPVPVLLYFVEALEDQLILRPEIRLLEEPVTPESALEMLLQGPEHADLTALIPEGTELLSFTHEEGEPALVDFSAELQTEFNLGSEGEALLLQSIVRTLAAFPDIQAVQILIDGDIVETIGGHMSVQEPLPIDEP